MRHTRTRRLRRSVAIAVALLVATPDAALAASGTTASRSMDGMSPQELELFVQQLNETANWRKYRRPNDPPDFEPGKPVKVMHGAGSSFGRGGGSGGFRKSGLANRRGSRSGRGKNRDDAMAKGRGSSRSSRSGSGSTSSSNSRSRSNSSFGGASRNGGSSFGNSSGNGVGGFDQ